MCARIPSPGPAYPNSPPDRRPHTAAQTLSLKGANLTSRPLFFRSMTAQKEDIAAQNLKVRHDLNQQRLSTRAPHWLWAILGVATIGSVLIGTERPRRLRRFPPPPGQSSVGHKYRTACLAPCGRASRDVSSPRQANRVCMWASTTPSAERGGTRSGVGSGPARVQTKVGHTAPMPRTHIRTGG